jgi:hypothetical protein
VEEDFDDFKIIQGASIKDSFLNRLPSEQFMVYGDSLAYIENDNSNYELRVIPNFSVALDKGVDVLQQSRRILKI